MIIATNCKLLFIFFLQFLKIQYSYKMDDTGTKIRNALKTANISVTELGDKIKMNPLTINNIIYGKSRKYHYLRKLEDSLSISLVEANQKNDVKIDKQINLKIYNSLLENIKNIVKKYNILMPKKHLDNMVEIIYNEKKYNDEDYIYGMLKFGVLSGYYDINLTKDEPLFIKKNIDVDVDVIHNLFNVLYQFLKQNNYKISKKYLDIITSILYDRWYINNQLSKEQINHIIKGMIDLGVNLGIID